MKEIKKEILVKKVILTEEEMSEVVGGASVKSITGQSILRKSLSWWRKG
ncbi:lactacin F inducer peptide precursor [Lactobacillus johnsonii]